MNIGVMHAGQAPLPGLAVEIQKLIGTEHQVIELGILDDMSETDLKKYKPSPGEPVTVVRLRNGHEITVSSNLLYPMGQDCVTRLEQEGADLIFPACSGHLPDYEHSVLYISTFHFFKTYIDILIPRGTLAVIMPSNEQLTKAEQLYSHPDRDLVVEAASPSLDDDIQVSARRLNKLNPDLVVFACFLVTSHQRSIARSIMPCPVLTSRSITLNVISELVSAWPLKNRK